FARRHTNRLRIRPRREPADLCHVSNRRWPETHFVWRGTLCDAGLVAERRLYRLYQAKGRFIRDRRHASRWVGRADPDRRLSQRRADLGPERPLSDVLSRSRRPGWRENLYDRRVRTRRIPGTDAELWFGSVLEPASQLGVISRKVPRRYLEEIRA